MTSKTNSKPKKDAFVFYDGNNFYHNVKKMKLRPSDIDFSKLSEIICSHFNCNHKKSIYYNSIPNIKDGEKMYWRHISFLKDVEKLPKFIVKTRKLQRSSTAEVLLEKKETLNSLELCDKCKPIVEATCSECIGIVKTREKGIDVMIAVDILSLSVIENKCDCCILVSGDADFVPVLNLIKKNNKNVFSAFVPKGYSLELRANTQFFVLNRELLLDECMK